MSKAQAGVITGLGNSSIKSARVQVQIGGVYIAYFYRWIAPLSFPNV